MLEKFFSWSKSPVQVVVNADPETGDMISTLGESSGFNIVTLIDSSAISTTQFSAGDCLGGLRTLANAVDGTKLTASIFSVCVASKSVQTCTLDLHLFNANPSASTFTDNSAPAINGNDVFKQIETIPLLSPKSSLGTHTFWSYSGVGKSFKLPSTSLYALITVRSGTPTFGANDLQLSIDLAQYV